MMGILRRMNAKPEVIYAAQLLSCDTFYAKDVKATMYSFVNIVNDATGFKASRSYVFWSRPSVPHLPGQC